MKKNIRALISCIVVISFAACGGGGGDGGGGGGGDTAPVTKASNDIANTDVDNAVTIDVLTNDTVVDGGTLSITNKTDGTSGSVNINADNTLTYTPNSGFSGTDTFTYTASDGKGGASSATVTVHVGSPPNTDPVAVDDSASTSKDVTVNISVLANDNDPDGDSLIVTAVTQGSNGSVVINSDNTVTYSPNSGYVGSDSFTYTISDGVGSPVSATVMVTVIGTTACSGSTGPYLAYLEGNNIYAVDKNDPTCFTHLASDVLPDSSTLIYRYTLNAAITVATASPAEILVYAGASKIWKVDMSAGSSLTPVALMVDAYSELCDVQLDKDELSLENSLLFYELPGADGVCFGSGSEAADNTRWMLRVAKSSTYSPVEITSKTDELGSLITVRDETASLAVLGFITIKGSDVIHYDASFSSQSVIKTALNPTDYSETRLDIDEIDREGGFMQIDRAVYWYNFQTKTLSSALYTIPSDMVSSDMDCDATECFFENVNVNPALKDRTIYRIPANGSGAASVLATVIGGYGGSWNQEITANYIYINNRTTMDLISIARSDGTVTTVDTNVDNFVISNNTRYYNRGDSAVIVANDGTPISSIPNAAWVGLNYVSFNIDTRNIQFERLLLAQKAAGQTDFSGATLQSYDPTTNMKDVDLGTLPTGTVQIYGYAFGAGGMLGLMQTSSKNDLLWMNPTVADSLTRLTNDAQFEIPLM